MTQKAQEKATATATATENAGQVDLAPPFYQPWRWGRSYPQQGFWSAARHFDNQGELVLQLGRDAGSGSSKIESTYLRYMGSTSRKLYTARFDPISLTRKPNNGSVVRLKAFMQVNGYRIERDLYPGQTAFIGIGAQGWHVLRVGVSVKLESGGNYGEVIARISDVNQFDLYSTSATRGLAEAGEPSLADLQAELESDGGPAEIVELGSLRQVAEAGLPAEG